MFELKFGPGTTILAIIFGVGALLTIGYLTDVSDEDKKKQAATAGRKPGERKMPTQEEFAKMSPQEQQRFVEEMRQEQAKSSSPQEKQIHKLLEAAEAAKTRGDYSRAEECYTQAISLLERDPAYGSNHYYVGLSAYALALVYKTNNQLEKSVPMMKKAIAILEKNVSAQPEIAEQVADALATLADVFISLKRFDEAEIPLSRSITIVKAKNEIIRNYEPQNAEQEKEKDQELRKTHQELGILLDTLTKLRFEQGKYSEAEDIGRNAIAVMEAAFGRDKTAEPLIHRSWIRLAEILLKLDKEAGACEIFDRLLTQKEGEGSGAVVASYCRVFARTCKENGKSAPAVSYLIKLIPLLEKDGTRPSDLIDLIAEVVSIYGDLNNKENVTHYHSKLLEKLQETRLDAPLPSSKYIQITKAAVEFNTDSENKQPHFSIAIKNLILPPGAVLVCTFPASDNTTSQNEVTVTEQADITITSSDLDKVENQHYYSATITIYSDSSKETELAIVPIVVKSN